MIKVYYGVNADINEIDAYFDTQVSLDDLDSKCEEYMSLIDKAKKDIESIDGVETKYGKCSKDDLSTGLKTLLTTYLLMQNEDKFTVNIDECGPNVISEIFKLVDNTDVGLVINHTGIPRTDDYSFVLNDMVKCNGTLELRERIKSMIRGARND